MALSNLELVKSGFDSILSLLDHQEKLFPRTIKTSFMGQIVVYSKEQALTLYAKSGFRDCWLNGYPHYSNQSIPVPPTLLFLDLDEDIINKRYSFQKSIESVLNETINKIKVILNGHPMILKTGGGYHIYQPIQIRLKHSLHAEGLQALTNFNQFMPYINKDPTADFIRFSEKCLSNSNHDPLHNPSPGSCLIRIPNTLNHKYNNQVLVIQEWNGEIADANGLVLHFYSHLIQRKIDSASIQTNELKYIPKGDRYKWIDRLIQTPIEDFRKHCLWRILSRYLINIKGLDKDQSTILLTGWLEKCDQLKKLDLDFRPSMRIRSSLNGVKSFWPPKVETLRNDQPQLYQLLKSKNIIH